VLGETCPPDTQKISEAQKGEKKKKKNRKRPVPPPMIVSTSPPGGPRGFHERAERVTGAHYTTPTPREGAKKTGKREPRGNLFVGQPPNPVLHRKPGKAKKT